MEKEQPVTVDLCLSAQDHTPFEGFITKGWPVQTIVRGHVVFDRGEVKSPSRGEYIRRPVALHPQED
jgi:dihydroorotase-like cyclic amidohydrolase